jgi:hypothetical protein
MSLIFSKEFPQKKIFGKDLNKPKQMLQALFLGGGLKCAILLRPLVYHLIITIRNMPEFIQQHSP